MTGRATLGDLDLSLGKRVRPRRLLYRRELQKGIRNALTITERVQRVLADFPA